MQFFFGIAGHLMEKDLGRLVDGREARRPHSALPSGTRLCYPLAAGGTDKDDATYHDDDVAEALPAAEPPVASPAQIQSKLSSFSMPASTSSVVSQALSWWRSPQKT